MPLFRITHCRFEETFNMNQFDTEDLNEWATMHDRIDEVWKARYEYESKLVNDVLSENKNIKKVLELGSGPGALSQLVLKDNPSLDYHLVDKPFSKKHFEENNFKGKFFVKDLSASFDTTGLDEKYDLIIANDFLEHVFNPHAILKKMYELTHANSLLFISNPNWRMAHQYVYRGLFDFDNFVYMFYTHFFKLEGIYGTILKTPPYPKRDTETLLPDENLTDWNHYMIFSRRDNI